MSNSEIAWKLLKIKKAQEKSSELTMNSGASVQNPNLEDTLYDRVMEYRFSELSTRSSQKFFYGFEDGIHDQIEVETESDYDWLLK